MTDSTHDGSRGDDALGMDVPISRRDFLNSTLIASGALLTSHAPAELLSQAIPEGDTWTGFGGIGDYAGSNGNTLRVMTDAHQIRDGVFERLPADTIDTGESYDCIVVGGGISGLAAALIFGRRARPGATCLVLDNHAIFGGDGCFIVHPSDTAAAVVALGAKLTITGPKGAGPSRRLHSSPVPPRA